MATEHTPDIDPSGNQRAQRLNVTVRPETYARLQEARNKGGLEINVSQVADAAINAELERLERPGIADLVARLRVESDRRRGQPYREGFAEGRYWAAEVASWAEIRGYATLSESDVSLERHTGEERYWLTFKGRFVTPNEYLNAPVARIGRGLVDELDACDQYWRGWLAGVQEIFNLVKDELPSIEPVLWTRGDPPPVDVCR